MTETRLADIVQHLDTLLETGTIPDYPGAINGLQFGNSGAVTRIAAAVDFSSRAVDSAIADGCNLLLVHHGMFWSGPGPLVGESHARIRRLLEHDVAVYASHLPLDCHPRLGNNVLLAEELGLVPSAGFARFQTVSIGVRGDSDIPTESLAAKAATFAQSHGGTLRTTPIPAGHRTRRWAICTGSGASADTLREAAELGIDTLIVGEGAHWTAVHAADTGLIILYAGHYATETLGVCALAQHLSDEFSIPWTFLRHPTGL